MSYPTSGRDYDPLPLTHDVHSDTLYNAPHPSRDDPFRAQTSQEFDLSDESAPRPRFVGAALYDEGIRDSYASSHQTVERGGSEYNSSVYGLNDPAFGPTSLSSPYHDDPHDLPGDRGLSMSPMGKSGAVGGTRMMEEKRAMYASPKSKRKVWIIVGAGVATVLVIIVVVGVYFGAIKSHHGTSTASDATTGDSSSGSSSNPSSASSGSSKSSLAVTGGGGSTITTENGTTFTYNNSFGGTWYWDVNDPFNNAARPQSWSPALNETFNYGIDKIRG